MLALTFATYAVTLNGAPVLPHTRAAVVAGHVLLPIRALGEALGADVRYDAAARRVVIRRGTLTTTLLIGGSLVVAQGHAYAPLRTVATTFGFTVDYAARSHTVALGDAVRAVNAGTIDVPTPRPPNAVVVTTTPGDGAQVDEPYPAISARFAGVPGIDPNSVRLLIDSRDVTPDAAVIGDQVLYTPRSALVPGHHDVRIDARAVDGSTIGTAWSFDDSFAFAPPPAPAPFPISAIYVDRWVQPGTSSFDVIVRGAPGLTGWVGVDGINAAFPLIVATYNAYVAHVYIPPGLNEPFAHVTAQITLPNGASQTIVLPQTIALFTPPGGRDRKPPPTPAPRTAPAIRLPYVAPSATPTPVRRHIAAPSATPTPPATPRPIVRPLPVVRRTPIPTPTPSPPPVVRPAAAVPRTPAPTPSAVLRRILRISPRPSPTPRPTPTPTPTPAP